MKKMKKNYYLNQFIILYFIFILGITISGLAGYFQHLIQGSLLWFIINDSIFFLIFFLLLYIRKKRQEKPLPKSNDVL
jgi:quinol-cytochrome oxidoreductase complex cytochrome b subunit